ncbi:GntR family transcriptional regulator [Saccharopolyspora gloriosae]|uniref:GntR family transcriptional regulator n=1 Tax=Saccharopolyspora gloriosae TaxID=455344 RepID=UPI001FB6A4FA|nr:GntR family transcriptional regulator [Saccharopolyspora gloriosae]
MTGSVEDRPVAPRAPSITDPPSLVELAASTLRSMIVGGELRCGERIIENRLTHELGISRPPLREALRVLEREGLVRQLPRKGVIVTPLTLHDVYEIVTLRRELERLAVRLGVPVREPGRLHRCRAALAALEEAAGDGNATLFAQRSLRLRLAVVGLAGNRRLEDACRSLGLQLMLAMTLNHRAPDRALLHTDLSRQRRLVGVIDGGDADTVLAELARCTDPSMFDGIESTVGGHSEEAVQWLRRERAYREDQ